MQSTQSPSPLQLTQFRVQLKKFVEFSDEQWDLVSSRMYLKEISKKELFVSGDKVCSEVGFILAGSLRFFFVKDGVELSNYFCFQHELISSYRSFLKRTPSIISIDAMEDSTLICFTYDSLQQLLKDDRVSFAMEHFCRMIAEYLICCYEERVFSFLTQTPEERYMRLLDEQPHFLNLIPQHYLANYLGVTAVSLSRIRKRIQENRPKQKLAS